jgi:hypothetical protein
MKVPHIIADNIFMEALDPEEEEGEFIESESNPISLLDEESGSAKDENNMKNKMSTTTKIIIIKGDTEANIGC